MEVARPQATPEPPIENKRATGLPEAAEVRKEEDAAEAAAASSAPGLGKDDNEREEDEDGGGSPNSISSWHGTPTWNDITTFSQVRRLTRNPSSDATLSVTTPWLLQSCQGNVRSDTYSPDTCSPSAANAEASVTAVQHCAVRRRVRVPGQWRAATWHGHAAVPGAQAAD